VKREPYLAQSLWQSSTNFLVPMKSNVGQRAAGERRKPKPRIEPTSASRIGDHVESSTVRAASTACTHQKRCLQLLDVERIRIEMLRLQAAQFGHRPLLALALLGIIVKPFAVLATEAALLFDHLDRSFFWVWSMALGPRSPPSPS